MYNNQEANLLANGLMYNNQEANLLANGLMYNNQEAYRPGKQKNCKVSPPAHAAA